MRAKENFTQQKASRARTARFAWRGKSVAAANNPSRLYDDFTYLYRLRFGQSNVSRQRQTCVIDNQPRQASRRPCLWRTKPNAHRTAKIRPLAGLVHYLMLLREGSTRQTLPTT